jgi:hypothetical protein
MGHIYKQHLAVQQLVRNRAELPMQKPGREHNILKRPSVFISGSSRPVSALVPINKPRPVIRTPYMASLLIHVSQMATQEDLHSTLAAAASSKPARVYLYLQGTAVCPLWLED